MKQKLFSIALAATVMLATAGTAQAACIAQYKAKKDNPLELFFDQAQISGPCTVANAQSQLRRILAAQGLTLLKVVSVQQS